MFFFLLFVMLFSLSLSLHHADNNSPCAPLLERAAAISRPMPLSVVFELVERERKRGEHKIKQKRETENKPSFLSFSFFPSFSLLTSWDRSRCRSAPRWGLRSRRWGARSGGGGAVFFFFFLKEREREREIKGEKKEAEGRKEVEKVEEEQRKKTADAIVFSSLLSLLSSSLLFSRSRARTCVSTSMQIVR